MPQGAQKGPWEAKRAQLTAAWKGASEEAKQVGGCLGCWTPLGTKCRLSTGGSGTRTHNIPHVVGKGFYVSRKERKSFRRLFRFKIPHSYFFYTKPSIMD